MTDVQKLKRRRWADIAVIISGAFAVVWGIWTPPTPSPEIHQASWWWGTAMGGFLALLSVFAAVRSLMLGRVLLGLAIVVLVGALLTFPEISAAVLVTVALPAIAMMVAFPFFGPMPVPEDEGRERRGL